MKETNKLFSQRKHGDINDEEIVHEVDKLSDDDLQSVEGGKVWDLVLVLRSRFLTCNKDIRLPSSQPYVRCQNQMTLSSDSLSDDEEQQGRTKNAGGLRKRSERGQSKHSSKESDVASEVSSCRSRTSVSSISKGIEDLTRRSREWGDAFR